MVDALCTDSVFHVFELEFASTSLTFRHPLPFHACSSAHGMVLHCPFNSWKVANQASKLDQWLLRLSPRWTGQDLHKSVDMDGLSMAHLVSLIS